MRHALRIAIARCLTLAISTLCDLPSVTLRGGLGAAASMNS
jgi:hypothetical protein